MRAKRSGEFKSKSSIKGGHKKSFPRRPEQELSSHCFADRGGGRSSKRVFVHLWGKRYLATVEVLKARLLARTMKANQSKVSRWGDRGPPLELGPDMRRENKDGWVLSCKDSILRGVRRGKVHGLSPYSLESATIGV